MKVRVFNLILFTEIYNGGKQNETCIIEQFQRKLKEIDQDRKLVYCFFFSSESNFQTAGEFLCATFPEAMCFKGGEHVLSLIVSNLFKLKPTQDSLFF